MLRFRVSPTCHVVVLVRIVRMLSAAALIVFSLDVGSTVVSSIEVTYFVSCDVQH